MEISIIRIIVQYLIWDMTQTLDIESVLYIFISTLFF